MFRLRLALCAAALVGVTLAGVWPAAAQGNFPPSFVDVVVSSTPCAAPTPWDPDVDGPRLEGSVLYLCVQTMDQDFDDPDTAEDELILITVRSSWVPYVRDGIEYGPEPPPVPSDRTGAYTEADDVVSWYTGFPPAAGNVTDTYIEFQIPEFHGANQARYRGYIDYDVRWVVELTCRNQGAEDFPADVWVIDVTAVEDPALQPGNPPPFADAGGDQIVASGHAVTLDGSRSFDRSNVGFSPFDEDTFFRDELQYTWEWVSGPAVVNPVDDGDGDDATVQVTLNTVGTYVYRLLVEDGVNAEPSTDSVTITVVTSLPDNHPPHAKIIASDTTAAVGDTVELRGDSSTDVDGDTLTYRWRQTNEVGGALAHDEVASLFQPLDGVTSSVASWTAMEAGTYYFALVVTDPFGEADIATVTIQVSGGGAGASAAARNPDAGGQEASEAEDAGNNGALAAPVAPAGCGNGGLLPLAMLPAMLWALRGRRW